MRVRGLKVNLGKTKVMVSGMEGKVLVSKVDPCGIMCKEGKSKFSVVWRNVGSGSMGDAQR